MTKASVLLPREITKAGPLKAGLWLHGVVVRLRKREIAWGSSWRHLRCGSTPSTETHGFEVHICGGSTPSDVILVEAWDLIAVRRLQALAEMGKGLKFSNCNVKPHTDKSRQWTTSRLPWFLSLPADASIEVTAVLPEWPKYHPVTGLKAIRLLAQGQLCCLAGRVMDPKPVKKEVTVLGEDTQVTNMTLRMGDDVIQIAAWRNYADKPLDLQVGEIYFFEAMKYYKLNNDSVECRYIQLTKVSSCEPGLAASLATTSLTTVGANMLTRVQSNRNVLEEPAPWYTLSMCAAVCVPNMHRSISDVVQVPSVLMSIADGGLAYIGCSACKKGRLDGQATCRCNKDARAYWKANVLLTDNTAQVPATMFDVTADLEPFADLQGGSFDPSRFAEDKDAADNLMLTIAAIPFTMLIEFQDSEFVGGLALVVRKLAPTFLGQAGSPAEGVDHPCKAIPRRRKRYAQ